MFNESNIAAATELANFLHITGRWDEEQVLLRSTHHTEALVIRYMEMDISHACNLTCTACTHYSNYNMSGYIEFDHGSKWMDDWSPRIMPLTFRLLGGEPTLNPRLCDYIKKAYELWPDSKREVVSNGFFINRHPDLFKTLSETKTSIQITIHEDSLAYLQKCHYAEIKEASQAYGFEFSLILGLPADFGRQYQGDGKDMLPFSDNDPHASFSACCNSGCYFMTDGMLWKCPPSGLLSTIDKKFDLSMKAEWQPYLNHKGLTLDASDSEIMNFFYRSHPICGMCPAKHVPV